jgi:DNA-binding response OmpR family regulator
MEVKLESRFETWLNQNRIVPRTEKERAINLMVFAANFLSSECKDRSPILGTKLLGGLELCDLTLDGYRHERGQRTALDLTKMEWKFLKFMAAHQGSVVTRDEILNQVWEKLNIYPRAVDTMVSKVRTKIAGTGVLIETRHAHGYILTVKDQAVA